MKEAPHHNEERKVCVNLGCGSRYCEGWRNYDLAPAGKEVAKFDLASGIPEEDNTVDLVYSSHLLEHLRAEEAENLIDECHRILKPGGLLRTVVPDLAFCAEQYLKSVRENRLNPVTHRWFTAELIDQMVRTESGGAKIKMILEGDKEFADWLREYGNSEIRSILDRRHEHKASTSSERSENLSRRWKLAHWLMVRLCKLDVSANDIEEFLFLRSGERHQWMYDEILLSDLLSRRGFTDVERVAFDRSKFPDWDQFELDRSDGLEYKPGSLYVEAVK